jgi:hypothetical protein
MNEELKKAIADALVEFKNGLPTSIEKAEVNALITEKMNVLETRFEGAVTKEQLADFSAQMKALVDSKVGKTVESKELKSLFADHKKELQEVKNKARKQVEFEIKTVGDMTTGNVAVADATPRLSLLGAEGQVYGINRSTGENIMSFVDLGTTDRASITWVDEVEGEGTVGATNEGSKKNQIDVDFKEKVATAGKNTAFVKITDESIDDISYMSGEVNRVINEKLMAKDSADILTDIIANATTYSLTDYNGTVKDADIIDAVVVASAQSTLSGFAPQHIAMHPIDIAKFQLSKSSNIPRIVTTAGGMEVNGLRVIRTTNVAKGTFALGDFSKYRVRIYKRKLIIGLDGNDLTENKKTIVAETRMIKYVSSNEKTSFVKGTFATIIAAINKAS